jgi:hypothetical protein
MERLVAGQLFLVYGLLKELVAGPKGGEMELRGKRMAKEVPSAKCQVCSEKRRKLG